MELLIVGCLAFLATHLGISGTPLRAVLQNALGESPYLGVYSLLSFGSLGLMIYGYGQVPHADFLWYPSETAYKVTKVVMRALFIPAVFHSGVAQVLFDRFCANWISNVPLAKF